MRSVWIICLALLVGCGSNERDHQQQAEKPDSEPTWEEAVDAVRKGNSVEIRLQAPIDDAQLDDLNGLVKLERLNLPNSQISDKGLQVIVENVLQLELLRIGSPHITDAGLETIVQLKQLRFLHLIDVPITDAGLKHLAPMTWLESFYLDGSAATDEGLGELLKALPELHFHRDQQHLPGDPHADAPGH